MSLSPALVAGYLQQWLQEDESSPCLNEDRSSGFNSLPESGFITSLYRACLQQLSSLVQDSATRPLLKAVTRKDRVKEIQTKLCLFGDSFEDGKLESCLNSDQDLRETVLGLLYDIGSVLTQDVVISLLHKNKQDITSLLKSRLDQAKEIIEPENGDDSTDSDCCEDEHQLSIPQNDMCTKDRWLDPLSTYVDLLLDLCPTLEQTYREKYQVSHGGLCKRPEEMLVTAAAHPYVNNVRDKFPLADCRLIERLGEANWQRHERLRFFKKDECLDPAVVAVEPCQRPQSLFEPVSVFKDSALGSSLPVSSNKAPSLVSHSSFLSSNEGGNQGRFRVPKLPDQARYGESFLCPFCRENTSSINTRVDWKIHVFVDLQPYICTSNECPESLRTFRTRKEWFEHETACHLSYRILECQSCMETFRDTADILLHAETRHSVSTESTSLKSAVLSTATVTLPNPPESLKCPLCQQDGWSSHRVYATHVGKHMEEIALCALPPSPDDDDEDDDVNDEEGDLSARADDNTSSQKSDSQKNPPHMPERVRSVLTTNSLGPDGDEYIPLEYNGRKVDIFGYLTGGRSYAVMPFTLPGRGQKLFMMATECAKHVGYPDANILFSENGSLFKIDVGFDEVQHLIDRGILPCSYQARSAAVITARSVFRQFGSKVIENGRPVVDDYGGFQQNRNSYELGWRRPPRILVVEDDPTCRHIVQKFLHTFYCQVDCAVDGLEAVNKMQDQVAGYDIILMDIIMPNLDGVSATHIIRQFDKTTIIAMTSNIRTDDVHMYFVHGMDDILPKPFTRKSLLDMLNKHLMHLKAPPAPVAATPQLSASVVVPAHQPGAAVAPASSVADLQDPIVLSVIELLQRSGNRPHSIQDMVPILATTNAEIKSSVVPNLVLRIHLNRYFARSWTEANPCPLQQCWLPEDHRSPRYLLTQPPLHGDSSERATRPGSQAERKDTCALSLPNKDESEPAQECKRALLAETQGLGPGPGLG